VGCGIWREEEWRVEFVPARDEGGTRERRALRVYAGEQRAGGLGAWCLQEKKSRFGCRMYPIIIRIRIRIRIRFS
jgi:hypothetical protein